MVGTIRAPVESAPPKEHLMVESGVPGTVGMEASCRDRNARCYQPSIRDREEGLAPSMCKSGAAISIIKAGGGGQPGICKPRNLIRWVFRRFSHCGSQKRFRFAEGMRRASKPHCRRRRSKIRKNSGKRVCRARLCHS